MSENHDVSTPMFPPPRSAPRTVATKAGGHAPFSLGGRWQLLWIRLIAVLAVFGTCGSCCIRQVPVWDELVSVFPAAAAMSQEGLAFLERFRMSPSAGGAPAHSLTMVTAVTAMVFSVTRGESRFVLLHLFQMTLAGLALAECYRFLKPAFGAVTSLLLCLAILLFPLFQCQACAMYLEISELLFTLLAINAWVERRRGWSRTWTLLATCAKPTGIVVAMTLGLLEAFSAGGWKRRCARCLAMILPSAAVFLLQAALAYPVAAMVQQATSLRDFAEALFERFSYVWDLSALLVLFLGTAIYRLPRAAAWFKGLAHEADFTDPRVDRDRRRLVAYTFGIALVCFYLLGPFTGIDPILARYFLHSLPFMAFAIVDCLGRRVPQPVTWLALAAVCAFFVANHQGRFYPSQDRNDFSIAERSAECRDLLAAQKEGVAFLQSVPSNVPVLYGLFNHYMAQYPEFGYVSAPIRNGHCVAFERYWWSIRAKDFPSEFYLLMDYEYLGGAALQRLLQIAAQNPHAFQVSTVHVAQHGRYKTRVLRVSRIPRMLPPN